MIWLTVDSELDLPGGVARSIGGCADELSSLISRRGSNAKAAVRIQGEARTTQVQHLPTLQNKSQQGKGRGQNLCH